MSPWPPGLPTKRTRVLLDCGPRGPRIAGTVTADGPWCCEVKWDHGPTQVHPIGQLMPEVEH